VAAGIAVFPDALLWLLAASLAIVAAALLVARHARVRVPKGHPAAAKFEDLARDIGDPRVRACFEQMARWSERLEDQAGDRSRRIADAVRADAKRLAFDALEQAARKQGDDDLARRLSEERRRFEGVQPGSAGS